MDRYGAAVTAVVLRLDRRRSGRLGRLLGGPDRADDPDDVDPVTATPTARVPVRLEDTVETLEQLDDEGNGSCSSSLRAGRPGP